MKSPRMNKDIILRKIYGEEQRVLEEQIQRYNELEKRFLEYFGEQDMHYFSTPGRVEIGGNHTDHNNGRVLAAAINLDSIAIASPTNDNIITIHSAGYNDPFIVDLKDKKVHKEETGTTSALVHGIAACMEKLDNTIGGFNAVISSDVLIGSGMSSSASIEVLLASILDHLYNGGKNKPETLAKIGQYAENKYFGKPCGLMDQMACAVGGIISIDFKDLVSPLIQKIDFTCAEYDHKLLLVDSGGNHADLTNDYAAIPAEMKSVAEMLDGEVCRDIDKTELIERIPEIRKKLGDRAVLRALHFIDENERVSQQVQALEQGDFKLFLKLVNESGKSSFKWLQNIYTTSNPKVQSVSLALAITEQYLTQNKAGACRIHGGGFAGTILVILPDDLVDHYIALIKPVFGDDSVIKLKIRPYGAIYLYHLS